MNILMAMLNNPRGRLAFGWILLFVLFFLALIYLRFCGATKQDCIDKIITTSTHSSDTLYIDSSKWHTMATKKNIKPVAVYAQHKDLGLVIDQEAVGGKPSTPLDPSNKCNDIAYYIDSNRAADYTIVIRDSIQNASILSRSIDFNDRRPTITNTVTNTVTHYLDAKKEFPFRLFLGISAYGDKSGKWGVGPSALVTTRWGWAMGYGYDAKQNQHNGSFYMMLKFKKNK